MINLSIGMPANLQVKLLRTLSGHKQSVYAVAKGHENSVYSAGGDGYLVKWNPMLEPDGRVVGTVPEPIYSLAFDAATSRLFAGSQSGYLYVVENDKARKIEAHAAGLYSILMLDNGFITAGGDGKLILWNQKLEIIKQKQISKKALRKIILIPGGYACAGSEAVVYYLSPELNVWEQNDAHNSTVFALAFASNTNAVISGGRDAQLHIQKLGDADATTIAAHLLHIHDIQLSPDMAYMATSSMDKTIKIWDLENLQLLKVLDVKKFGLHLSSVNAICWVSAQVLVSISDDKNLGVWVIGGE